MTEVRLRTRDLDRRLRIERPIPDPDADGAGSGDWLLVADRVAANVQDMLPSRATEQVADGVNVSLRRARVRIRYRDDITADMRFVMGGRIMQIVAGPAELGRRGGLEFLSEDYSTAGNPA